ncbi:MAG TPA: HNH endonuclease [Oceanobacillus sp.]|nr:HNH endonuclease [Oceanobacillus sp.]
MTYISAALRREVRDRAGNCCEYCRVHEEFRLFPYEVDHIIAEKHRGETVSDNLCYSCYLCNGHKGSDIASIDPLTGELAALFHPRRHIWTDHFRLNGGVIEPLTPEGRVTVHILQLNTEGRVKEREGLLRMGRYPCS